MFARTLYLKDLGHVFFSAWAFNLRIDSSDLLIFFAKASVLLSYLVLLLGFSCWWLTSTRHLRVRDRLRIGDHWSLSNSSSLDSNSELSSTAEISLSLSVRPDVPGNSSPFWSSIFSDIFEWLVSLTRLEFQSLSRPCQLLLWYGLSGMAV